MSILKQNNKIFTTNNTILKTDWKPNKLNNLFFWANCDKKNILENNNFVYEWKDISGNLNKAFQNNTSNKPIYTENIINGYSAIKFNNNDNLKLLANLNFFTVFTVIKTSDSDYVYEFSNSNTETGFYLNGDENTIAVTQSGLTNLASIKEYSNNWLGDNNWKIIAHTYNGTHTSNKLYINNTLISLDDYFSYTDNPGSLNKQDYFYIGSNSNNVGIDGYISEFLLFNESLNLQTISKIFNYLNNKYLIY